jgi:TonB family protein
MRSRLVCLALVAACHPTPPLATVASTAPPPAPAPTAPPPASTIDLDKLLASQTRGFYACFESQAATRPEFGGHLDANVEVDTTGRVVNVEISASTFPDDSVLPCLLRAWRAVRVPPPPDHATGHMRLAWEKRCGSTPLAPGKGSMEKEMIRTVIRSHLDEVRVCYEQKLATNPALHGRVMVQFTVGHEGTVVAAFVQSSTLDDADVDACIVEATRRWRYPPACGSGIVIVSYPFVLQSADAAP